MITIRNKVLKEAKLPLSVCRGNQNQRRALASNLNNAFMTRLRGYDVLSEDIVSDELKTFLGKNKINVNFVPKVKNRQRIAAFAPQYHVEHLGYGELNNVCSGFDMQFRNPQKLTKKYVAHEFSHFFGAITNPKVLNIEGAPYCANIEEWKLCEGVLEKYFRPQSIIENEKGAVNDIHATVQSVPKNMRISALKLYKKKLLTEKNAYYDERVWAIKFAKGPKEKLKAVKEYLEAVVMDKKVFQFKKKERILKTVIRKVFNPEID